MKYSSFLGASILMFWSAVASAQQPTAEEMIKGLLPGAPSGQLTRSWKPNRGVEIEGAKTIYGPPSIDLYINFKFDSDKLLTDSLITLDNLTTALKDPGLN